MIKSRTWSHAEFCGATRLALQEPIHLIPKLRQVGPVLIEELTVTIVHFQDCNRVFHNSKRYSLRAMEKWSGAEASTSDVTQVAGERPTGRRRQIGKNAVSTTRCY